MKKIQSRVLDSLAGGKAGFWIRHGMTVCFSIFLFLLFYLAIKYPGLIRVFRLSDFLW